MLRVRRQLGKGSADVDDEASVGLPERPRRRADGSIVSGMNLSSGPRGQGLIPVGNLFFYVLSR